MKRLLSLLILTAGILLSGMAGFITAPAAAQATFTVNSTADHSDFRLDDGVCLVCLVTDNNGRCLKSGGCTLRAAIEQANYTAGQDQIQFALPSSAPIIQPTALLPPILYPVLIYGQIGTGGRVELDGSLVGSTGSGLAIFSGKSQVLRMNIHSFRGPGLYLDGGGSIVQGCYLHDNKGDGLHVPLGSAGGHQIGGTRSRDRNIVTHNTGYGVYIGASTTGGNVLEGNYIGIAEDGMTPAGNKRDGIFITNNPDTRIGGAMTGAGNVIAANTGTGITVSGTGASNTRILGNHIGTDATGLLDRGNAVYGIAVFDAPKVIIGGTTVDARNVVSDNGKSGITIQGMDATGSTVQGNYVGLGADGQTKLGNTEAGVFVSKAPKATIGGTDPGARNVISDNTGSGVIISEAADSKILNNYIGTDAKGNDDLGNRETGILINDALNAQVGDATAAGRNVISGNEAHGIAVQGSATADIFIRGNYIGTNDEGKQKRGNTGHGVFISKVPDVIVGGLTPEARNVISGNGGNGISILGAEATDTKILGNYIGTDAAGTLPLGNEEHGVRIREGTATIIGGLDAGSRNLISGNMGNGIVIREATDTIIQGNYIGTDVNGERALKNHEDGIYLIDALRNRIGGTLEKARNIISGNRLNGVSISGSTSEENVVEGNYIGLYLNVPPSQKPPLGNEEAGVFINEAPRNRIGGEDAGARNIISSNGNSGIVISGQPATGNLVQGNYIGTTEDGMQKAGNAEAAVFIDNAPNNRIGGAKPEVRNLLSGNTLHGVALSEAGAFDNRIQGNYIGLGADGTVALGNGNAGIRIRDAMQNLIGGTGQGEANHIAHNGADGIYVVSGSGNGFIRNSIFANQGLGINLDEDGNATTMDDITENDYGDLDNGVLPDTDTGANGLQNYPVITDAGEAGGNRRLEGELRSTPHQAYILEFFSNELADPSDEPEGQTFLTDVSVVTDTDGYTLFNVTLPSGSENITITARDPDRNTSEFLVGYIKVTELDSVKSRTNAVSGANRPDDLLLVEEKWNIHWTSANVDLVDLYFSPDSGKTVYSIVSNLSAADKVYEWTVPDSLSAKSQIVIRSAANASIEGTSKLFKVKDFELTRFKPDGSYEAFDPKLHGWQFGNSRANMWPPEWWHPLRGGQFDYVNRSDPYTQRFYTPRFREVTSPRPGNFPDWPLYVDAFGQSEAYHLPFTSDPYRHKALTFWKSYKGEWGGSCFGFAASTVFAFDLPEPFAQHNPGVAAFEHLVSVPLSGISRTLINRLQIFQYGRVFKRHRQATMGKSVEQLIDELKQMFVDETRDDRFLVFFAGNTSGAHAVVPYRIEADAADPNIVYVYVYDPNAPLDQTRRVKLFTGAHTFSEVFIYQPLKWSGKNEATRTDLFLSDPISNYLGTADMPEAAAKQTVMNNFLDVYVRAGANVELKTLDGKTVGYADSVAYNHLGAGYPIVPITGSFHPPIGYNVPAGAYTIQMSNFPDSSSYVSVFTEEAIYSYERSDAEREQTDFVTYGDGLHVSNDDPTAKGIRLGLILPEAQRERAFDLTGLSLKQGSSVQLMQAEPGEVRLINETEDQSFDLQLTMSSEMGSTVVTYSNVPLTSHAAHHLVPDWENLSTVPVHIYIDTDGDDVPDDSLAISGEAISVDVEATTTEIPNDFQLHQNYPNPFNPTTTILFDVQEPVRVVLKVYNLLGQEVATLVDGDYAPGRYEASFEAHGLSSGVYLYAIEMGNFREAKQMILVK